MVGVARCDRLARLRAPEETCGRPPRTNPDTEPRVIREVDRVDRGLVAEGTCGQHVTPRRNVSEDEPVSAAIGLSRSRPAERDGRALPWHVDDGDDLPW